MITIILGITLVLFVLVFLIYHMNVQKDFKEIKEEFEHLKDLIISQEDLSESYKTLSIAQKEVIEVYKAKLANIEDYSKKQVYSKAKVKTK